VEANEQSEECTLNASLPNSLLAGYVVVKETLDSLASFVHSRFNLNQLIIIHKQSGTQGYDNDLSVVWGRTEFVTQPQDFQLNFEQNSFKSMQEPSS
jgi:hypothetical protein